MKKLSIILLAAGNSTRFQGNKMLAQVEGKPMYLHMVDNILRIPALEKVLVIQHQEIIDTIKNREKYNGIKLVKNNHSHWGISHSIQLGLQQCSGDAYLFAVCDQPWLKRETILKLMDRYYSNKGRIACLSYHGRTGNPVIFDSSYREELLRLKGDMGGKSIMKRHMEDVVLVEAESPMELLDIDTKEDYRYNR